MSETKPELFRNEAKKHYNSPEKLDESIRLISRFEWLLLFAGGIVCAALLWWGLFGNINVRVTGLGILAFPQGIPSVTSGVSGALTKLYVKLEQNVEEGDLIAYVSQTSLDIQEQTLQKELDDYVLLHERLTKLETQNFNDTVTTLNNQKTQLEQSIEITNKQIQIYQEQMESYQRLYEKGIASKEDFDKTTVTLLNSKLSLDSLHNQIQSLLKSISDNEVNYNENIRQRELNISNKKEEIRELKRKHENDSTICAPYKGIIRGISVIEGQSVNANQEIVLIEPRKDEESNQRLELISIVYVTSIEAKKIRPGQNALISPTIVRPSQYGSITGQVLSISDYPVSSEYLSMLFPNSVLDEQFLAQGSVFEIRLSLDKSETSPSGYHWTGGEGPQIRLTAGTITNAMISVEQRRPISYLIPFIEQFFLGVDNYGVYGK
ncbi:MAG: NHLP bacteriocin system secretion protein [Planctomycetaceae bacterium]|jgi:HlyD family secretion protein|nr:NHLP bacteriocin system secretion protein [Planctomycetaceae bacterium]